jgi:prefoldin subunit 5
MKINKIKIISVAVIIGVLGSVGFFANWYAQKENTLGAAALTSTRVVARDRSVQPPQPPVYTQSCELNIIDCSAEIRAVLDLKNQIGQLEVEVSRLDGERESVKKSIDELSREMDNLLDQIDATTNKAELKRLNAKLKSLWARHRSLNEQLKSLDAQLLSIGLTLSDLRNKLQAAEDAERRCKASQAAQIEVYNKCVATRLIK